MSTHDTRSGYQSPGEIYAALENVPDGEEGDDLELALLRDLADMMQECYMVEFGGGYEAPSHVFFTTSQEAWKQAEAWAKDVHEDEGDYVDVIRKDWVTGICERLYR